MLRKLRIFAFLVTVSVTGLSFASGIPVFDGAAATNFIQQWTQMLKDYAMLQQQYDQAVRSFESMTGSRGFGGLHHATQWIRLLPDEYRNALKSVYQNGLASLSGSGQSIYDDWNLGERCRNFRGSQKTSCEREQALTAEYGASLESVRRQSEQILQEIQSLMAEVNRTTDMKGVAELQAQIASKQASMFMAQANMRSQMEMMRTMREEAFRVAAAVRHQKAFSRLSDDEFLAVIQR